MKAWKGNKHLVPVLFPRDVINPIRKLCNKEAYSVVSIAEKNIFLFPSTNGSDNHISGWHAVNNVCDKVELVNKSIITAIKNYTMFALMDVPEQDRQFIYKLLGHSEETNCNIYQTPLALKELTIVGKRLFIIRALNSA